MIDPNELVRLKRQSPFQPRRIHLNDGRAFDVSMPELMVVCRTRVDIGILPPGEKLPIAEYFESVPLDALARVDVLGVMSTIS